MNPRSLQQILSELDTTYNPQIQSIQAKQALIPQKTQASIAEAEGAQSQAYDRILGGARQRGLGFSGIPLGEQAQYASTVFAPQVLRAKQQGSAEALSLEDAILGINERRMSQGQNIFENERNFGLQQQQFAEQQRQFNENLRLQQEAQRRASSGGGSPSFTIPTTDRQTPTQPLSLRQQWQIEAKNGDWDAQVALNYAGDDGRYDGIVNSQAELDILRKMGIQGNYRLKSNAKAPAGTVQVGGTMGTGLTTLGGAPINSSKYNFGGK